MKFWLTRTHQFHCLPVLARRLPEYHNKVRVKLLSLYDRIENTRVQTVKTKRNIFVVFTDAQILLQIPKNGIGGLVVSDETYMKAKLILPSY